jgi:Putative MetA-pathway of phenol degradation
MNAQRPRHVGASGIMLLGAALVFVFDPAGSAALEPTDSAAPSVRVRAGDHGDFERVVFEWPEAVDHDAVHRAEQVTVSFSRLGRFDLSQVRDRIGQRVLDAWAEGGDVTTRVVLRVLPDTRIRSFSLEDGHVMVVDVYGGKAVESPVASAPDPKPDPIQELRREVEDRDALIESLLARVEQLERTVALSRGDLDRVTGGVAPSVGTTQLPPPGSRAVAAAEPSAGPSDPASPGSADRRAASPGEPERQETAQAAPPAAGQVEVDEEAAERALDFTLVEQGALLLPAGRVEVTPRFTYTRRTGDFPTIVDPGGRNLLGEREVRRNEFDLFAGLQVGLPLDSQLELGLPYHIVDQSITDRVGGTGVREQSDTGYGLGDFSVGLAKTMLREEGWWPDVILRVNWDTGTGERQNNDVVLDGGFQDITGSLSLAKRQDPLVFVGGGFYQWAYDEQDDIDPGDQFGFNIGTFLAVTPNTSLSLVLNQSFIDEFKISGQKIDGSDRVQSILSLGAGAVLGRNVLLSGSVGVGLTDDSPDYSVSISLPIRFSTPGL